MSMIQCLRMSSDKEIQEILEKPQRIQKLLFDEPLMGHEPGLIAKIFGAKAEPADVWAPSAEFCVETDEVDLDKAWHAIHFLLAASAWEGEGLRAFLLVGGKELGDVDVGYGPASFFLKKEYTDHNKVISFIVNNQNKFSFLQPVNA